MCCSEPWKILHSITGDDSSDALSEEFVQDKDVIKVDDVLSLLTGMIHQILAIVQLRPKVKYADV